MFLNGGFHHGWIRSTSNTIRTYTNENIIFFQFSGGESTLGIPETISFGTIVGDEPDSAGVYPEGPVPFRTIVMLIALFTHVIISSVTNKLFTDQIVSLDYDFMHCFELVWGFQLESTLSLTREIRCRKYSIKICSRNLSFHNININSNQNDVSFWSIKEEIFFYWSLVTYRKYRNRFEPKNFTKKIIFQKVQLHL